MNRTKQLPSSQLLNGYSRFFEIAFTLPMVPFEAVEDMVKGSDLDTGTAFLVLLVALPFTLEAGMALFILATLASLAAAATMLLTVPAALAADSVTNCFA